MMDGGWLSDQGSYEFYERDYPDPQIIAAGLLGCPYSLADMAGDNARFRGLEISIWRFQAHGSIDNVQYSCYDYR